MRGCEARGGTLHGQAGAGVVLMGAGEGGHREGYRTPMEGNGGEWGEDGVGAVEHAIDERSRRRWNIGIRLARRHEWRRRGVASMEGRWGEGV